MEFKQIQYFLCLFVEGSITRAARRLNIVQPALSMQISKLEEEIGKPLFLRNPRGMEPTEEGRRMYRLFEPVVKGFAQAREEMIQTAGELSGELRIGTVATVAQGVLVDVITQFSARHPKVSISITDGYGPSLADAVAGGRIEVAIVNKMRRAPPLAIEDVIEEQLMLVVGPRHPVLRGPVLLKDLNKLNLVLPTRQNGLRGLIESQVEARGFEIAPAVEMDSIAAMLKLVSKEPYATLLPRTAAELRSGSMRLMAYQVRPMLTRKLVSMTHPHRATTPQTAAFLALLYKQMRIENTQKFDAPN